MRFAPAASFAILLTACGGHESNDGSHPQTDAGADSTLPDVVQDSPIDQASDDSPEAEAEQPVCGSGNRPLPDGLIEIAWDDGQPVGSLRDQEWSIEVNGHTYVINDEVLWEAVRFDLPHPARIHGFSVQWAGLAEDAPPDHEVFAGLYPDFGYNGFDFWQWDPLWSGSRCRADISEEGWVDYVFDAPVDVPHPGLVYVAHRAETAADPVFLFDGTEGGTCEKFTECHGAMNLPNAEATAFYNGVSFPFQYDYLVRLHVEYTEEIEPTDRIFQPVTFAPSGHASFGDFDNDGWDDLIAEGPTLYRNDGTGSFVDVTESAGLSGVSGTGGVFGDFDNDGCLDLFVYAESTTEADSLFRSNCDGDGTFENVTEAAGIVDEQTYENCGGAAENVRSPTAAAAWVDIDADGYLDLYLANFICWSKETYYIDTVFHNLGDGTFESWTGDHGFLSQKRPSRGVAPVDYDADGDVDLFVNAYRLRANQLFRNKGDGTVEESAFAAGVAGTPTNSYFGHTIGAAWGDLDGDGVFDLVSANLAHPRFFHFSDKTEVLLQNASHEFEDVSGDWPKAKSAAGLRYQETHSVPALADFDHDGHLDLVITSVYDGRPTDFYWGNGDGTFRLDAYHAGITTENGWGVAVSDVDNDGDPDVFAHVPFVNTLQSTGAWLQVRAIGNVASNWNAIGSTVRVRAGGASQIRHVQGGTGKGGQDSQYLHFGLGSATEAERIEVVFPGGETVTYEGPFAAGQRVWVFEDGTTHLGWSPP
jgi:hypothetical protein